MSGIRTRMEEVGCFQEAYPNSRKRPDITTSNFPTCTKSKLVLDISMAHPIPILALNTSLSKPQALVKDRAAIKRHRDKCRKYTEIANANNLEFLPLIFETTGRMHPDTSNFFNVTVNKMANTMDIPPANLHLFWSARIACCIQKSLVGAILSRSRIINGRLTRERMNFELAHEFMGAFQLAN